MNGVSRAPSNRSRRERALSALSHGATVSAAARESELSRQHLHKLIAAESRFAEARQRGLTVLARRKAKADLAKRRGSHRLVLKLSVSPETFVEIARQARELEAPVSLVAAMALDNGVEVFRHALAGE